MAVLALDGKNLAQIQTGGHPEALQAEEKGNRIFINSPDNHYVVAADLDTNKVLAHWSNPQCENYPMALDEGHRRIVVFCRGASRVSVIETMSANKWRPSQPHRYPPRTVCFTIRARVGSTSFRGS